MILDDVEKGILVDLLLLLQQRIVVLSFSPPPCF